MALTPELDRTIARIGDLPSMPELVAEVLRLSDDPTVDMQQIANVISHDPGLTAKILRVSNSPYYGMRQYVGSLKLAMVVLGIREVRNIVLGMSLFDALRSEKAEAILANDFWAHSFLVGALTRKMATAMRLNMQGEDFVAGLLHDIGKMVLCRHKGESYGKLHSENGGGGEALCNAERSAYGFTHADVAAALAVKWNLPKTLVDAMWMHHPIEGAAMDDAKDAKLVALVRLANRAAHEQWDAGQGDRAEDFDSDSNWQWLENVKAPIDASSRRNTVGDILAELKATETLSFA